MTDTGVGLCGVFPRIVPFVIRYFRISAAKVRNYLGTTKNSCLFLQIVSDFGGKIIIGAILDRHFVGHGQTIVPMGMDKNIVNAKKYGKLFVLYVNTLYICSANQLLWLNCIIAIMRISPFSISEEGIKLFK